MLLGFQHKLEYAFGAFIFLFALYEWRWSRRHGVVIHDRRETLANLALVVGYLAVKGAFLAWSFMVLSWFYRLRMLDPQKSLPMLAAVILGADFLYYWEHRALHAFKTLWTLHVIHHSGQRLNLTTSFRLNWLAPVVNIFFYAPLSILGVPPQWTLFAVTLNIMYQYWLHTTCIPKLGWLEGVINTPSAHRVHHGSNAIYLDRNFAGILMIWDRLFGTYTEETEAPVYGTTKGFVGYNPLTLLTHGFTDYFRGQMTYRG